MKVQLDNGQIIEPSDEAAVALVEARVAKPVAEPNEVERHVIEPDETR